MGTASGAVITAATDGSIICGTAIGIGALDCFLYDRARPAPDSVR